jgi:hypothetical protein
LFFSTGSSGSLELKIIYTYYYDNSGRIEEITTFGISSQTISSTIKFTWEDGNIAIRSSYNADDELIFEYHTEYDNKSNIYKEIPYYYGFVHLSAKNEISSVGVDYGGQFASCDTCFSEFIYNLDGYPVEETRNSNNYKTEYIYE